jgi:hypothetical protein
MALTDKKYEKFYKTTGTGDDKAEASDLVKAEALWDSDRGEGCKWLLNDSTLGPIVFQLQQLQDELDYLRTEIAANKSKATFPGLGTSNSTALAGDTTTITTAQANAIIANTAKTSMVIGTGKGEAMSGQTNIPNVTVASDSGLIVEFTNLTVGAKSTTIELKITDHNQKTPPIYSALITLK